MRIRCSSPLTSLAEYWILMARTWVIKVGTVSAARMKIIPATTVISSRENPRSPLRIGIVQVSFMNVPSLRLPPPAVFERGQGSPRPGAPRSMFSLALPTGKITEDREKTLKRDHQSALVPERESHSQCICAAVLPIRTVGILASLENRAWQLTTCNSLRLQSCNSPFQQPERVLGFFNTCRDGKRVICRTLTVIADDFHHWLFHHAERWRAPIVEAPQPERRDDFVLPYLQKTEAVILKAREPARILVAIGGKQNQCPHLELKQRWVNQYNFYLNDQHWGPMF